MRPHLAPGGPRNAGPQRRFCENSHVRHTALTRTPRQTLSHRNAGAPPMIQRLAITIAGIVAAIVLTVGLVAPGSCRRRRMRSAEPVLPAPRRHGRH